MPCVVADTGPLNYLVQIGCEALLPQLFGRVVLPTMVVTELRHARAPAAVLRWATALPPWVSVEDAAPEQVALDALDPGERAAMALARHIRADALIMDDRPGVIAARAQGLMVLGTIGVLDRAAQRGLVDLPQAVAALKATNFRYPPGMLDALLEEDRLRRD